MVEDVVPFGNCRKTQLHIDALRLNPEPRLLRRSLECGASVDYNSRNYPYCRLVNKKEIGEILVHFPRSFHTLRRDRPHTACGFGA
jgi:hypothetical protein